MRSDYQARSLHYFHSYAVRDRINTENFDDMPSAPDISQVNLDLILPTTHDVHDMYSNMSVLIARVLKKYMPFFKKYGSAVGRHIMHQYSEEMSKKSCVVSSVTL